MRDDSIEFEFDLLKDRRVGFERDYGAVHFRSGLFFRLSDRLAAIFVFLHEFPAVAMDFRTHMHGKCVHDGNTDAVKTARDFVSFAAEFSSGMEDGHDGLKCRDFGFRMNVGRNAAAVVSDTNAVARKERDFNVVGETAHSLVARVVENLPDEMVKACWASRSDVHSRPAAHRFKPFQHSNVSGSIGAFFCLRFRHMSTLVFYQILRHFARKLSPFPRLY